MLRSRLAIAYDVFRGVQRQSSTWTGQRWILKKHFEGEPTTDDFELVQDGPLPALKDGEILTKGLFYSVDPYMRVYPKMYGMKPPVTMMGSQVAEVVETRNSRYPTGTIIVNYNGWRELSVINPDTILKETSRSAHAVRFPPMTSTIDLPPSISKSHLLGAIGMTGITALYGLLDGCQPKDGETVVVSGAAGAVGSLVGQIAKLKGCHVIGIAGSDEKCSWLLDLGFDKAINYKTQPIKTSLLRAMPNKKGGVDCYFDNVGGLISHYVLTSMNQFGRIAVCGSISNYNDTKDNRDLILTLVPPVQPVMIGGQLRMEGIVVWRWLKDETWIPGLEQLKDWMVEGKIESRETIYEGFQNLPEAFIDMLKGKNIGKMIVKV